MIELRVTELTEQVIVPWELGTYVTFRTGESLEYGQVQLNTMDSNPSLGPAEVSMLAAGVGSLLALLVLTLISLALKSPSSAVRVGELAGAFGLAILAALAAVHLLDDVPAVLLGFVPAGIVAFVAWARPPSRSPRATTFLIGLLLLCGVLTWSRLVDAAPAGGIAILAVVIGVTVGVGLAGLFAPLSWWRERLGEPGLLRRSLVALGLVGGLIATAISTSVYGADLEVVLGPVLAVLAAWALLAYREWTEAPSHSWRVASCVIMVLAILGGLATWGLGRGLFPSFGPEPPQPILPPLIAVAVAVIALVAAGAADPRFAWERFVDGKGTGTGIGLRGRVVVGMVATLAVSAILWAAAVPIPLTSSFPLGVALVVATFVALLTWGTVRWMAGKATLLRVIGLLLLPLALLGLIGVSGLLFAATIQPPVSGPSPELLRVATYAFGLAAAIGPLLAAIGTPPRAPRQGIDWTA